MTGMPTNLRPLRPAIAAVIVYLGDLVRLPVVGYEVKGARTYTSVNLWEIARNGTTLHETGTTQDFSLRARGRRARQRVSVDP